MKIRSNPVTEAHNRNEERTTFHVRYAETDAMGIVHHANYLVWFEEARSAFMRARGTSYTAFEAEGVALAVTEARVRYIVSARYDRRVTVACRVERVQSRKICFAYTVTDTETGQLLATGETHHICINRQGRVTRIPPAWRKLMAGT